MSREATILANQVSSEPMDPVAIYGDLTYVLTRIACETGTPVFLHGRLFVACVVSPLFSKIAS